MCPPDVVGEYVLLLPEWGLSLSKCPPDLDGDVLCLPDLGVTHFMGRNDMGGVHVLSLLDMVEAPVEMMSDILGVTVMDLHERAAGMV